MHNLSYEFGDSAGKILSVGDNVKVVSGGLLGITDVGTVTKVIGSNSDVKFGAKSYHNFRNWKLTRWEPEDRI